MRIGVANPSGAHAHKDILVSNRGYWQLLVYQRLADLNHTDCFHGMILFSMWGGVTND
jgi:hypothetical protein